MVTRNIGRIIREKRERKRLTVARAAELCGLSEQGLTHIELGDTDPRFSSLTRIAAVLDIDLGELNTCKQEEFTCTILKA